MGRVSRVEPAAVRHAGGERSAQHRFPRGAAGIDKGSAAASLVPFTAPVIKTFRPTPGERNPSTKTICQAHCRMAAAPYPAYRTSSTVATCRTDCRMALTLIRPTTHPFLFRWPQPHRHAGDTEQRFAAGAVARLDRHPLLDAGVKPG